ncbi:hypothetical protein EHS13_03550 [Paenibacillus psychroresistens]|uniref:Lipid A biosynthesis N-terminal domain-containing protein n=1 Tax=Paenibacillus psychroresistens TaxID=1778678 RepID=A0A6B8RCP4_9BACL|nr:lipid-A-disaccharide synthase N-terminal domain-containing protein [Paenibacillus psychroresistens]QGQ94049.1 hypothetical protein EHS13_03550 [Paenibacillus psychroresistens]
MWVSLKNIFETPESKWILFGFVGQLMFTGRFIIQWIASEKAKKSVVTRSFWTFSILGSSVLSVYAIYRQDPVFIVGQVPGILIYIRNLVIMRNQERKIRLEAVNENEQKLQI